MVGLGALSGLSRRSWAALGAYVGDLGLLLEPKLAVLGRIRAKVAQTRAGAGSVRGPEPEEPEAAEAAEGPGPGTYFFCRYTRVGLSL